MNSKVVFVSQETNWMALIPKILVIGILCFCFYQLDKQNFFVIAFVVYLVLTFLARKIFFPNTLHEAKNLIKEGKFGKAIPFIEKTIDYYTKHSWIDKYRFLLLISSAKRTIREASICNLAYCHLQLGDINKAKEIYQNVLVQYPENTNAKSMLRTINLISLDKTSS